MANPKPIFVEFTVLRAIIALKARKLPDLSGRQIRQFLWWERVDLNHLRLGQSIKLQRALNRTLKINLKISIDILPITHYTKSRNVNTCSF